MKKRNGAFSALMSFDRVALVPLTLPAAACVVFDWYAMWWPACSSYAMLAADAIVGSSARSALRAIIVGLKWG
jgi:hypothetical protein